MSLVKQIKDAIDGYIGALIPSFSSSQYVWDPIQNSDTKSKTYYAIRPSSARFVTGTGNTLSIEQDFTVEIGDSYKAKKDNDNDADEKVYSIYEAHETIYKAIARDNFGIARVQVVSGFSMSEPDVDAENKIVKIETIFTVRYRME